MSEYLDLTIDQDTPPLEVLIAKARAAQNRIKTWPQELVDRAVAAIGWHALQEKTAQNLAESAVLESGIGDIEDSLARLNKRVRGVMCDLHGQTTLGPVEYDEVRQIRKFAKPIGVIAVLVPSTAPVAAILMNVLMAVKTRNAVLLCPNPSIKRSCIETVNVIRRALAAAEVPPDLVQSVTHPSREAAQTIARQSDLVIATGGAATVARVASTGTPAYAAGPGNAIVIIDESADIERAASLIVKGKVFDNGTSCSSESSLLIADEIRGDFYAALRRNGVHICRNAKESARLRDTVWPDERLARGIVGRKAKAIAASADIAVDDSILALAAELTDPLEADPMSGEKLSPLMGLRGYKVFDEALVLLRRLTDIAGAGHSCGIYSQNQDHIDALAASAQVSRIMVNQSTGDGNTGSFTNGMPFTSTVSCGSWGSSTINENVNWRHLLNYTWISAPTERRVPSWAALVAPYHKH